MGFFPRLTLTEEGVFSKSLPRRGKAKCCSPLFSSNSTSSVSEDSFEYDPSSPPAFSSPSFCKSVDEGESVELGTGIERVLTPIEEQRSLYLDRI